MLKSLFGFTAAFALGLLRLRRATETGPSPFVV
jgi:hypothetical protein